MVTSTIHIGLNVKTNHVALLNLIPPNFVLQQSPHSLLNQFLWYENHKTWLSGPHEYPPKARVTRDEVQNNITTYCKSHPPFYHNFAYKYTRG